MSKVLVSNVNLFYNIEIYKLKFIYTFFESVTISNEFKTKMCLNNLLINEIYNNIYRMN